MRTSHTWSQSWVSGPGEAGIAAWQRKVVRLRGPWTRMGQAWPGSTSDGENQSTPVCLCVQEDSLWKASVPQACGWGSQAPHVLSARGAKTGLLALPEPMWSCTSLCITEFLLELLNPSLSSLKLHSKPSHKKRERKEKNQDQARTTHFPPAAAWMALV